MNYNITFAFIIKASEALYENENLCSFALDVKDFLMVIYVC